ncbi:SitA5 family polymorphic toxin [Archangium violaceum]|uniref:SitA5 family polymorphic toxin n=1 Tax=Archangium violaceum TaxID=83451 RepID=UPI0036DCB435
MLLFARLPTDFDPVRVGEAEFRAALSSMVLDIPLRVASSAPGQRGGGLAPGSGGSGGEAWQADMARSYGRLCEQRGSPGDCFTLFNDGPYLQDDDKRSIAMALAVGPALEGIDAEVRAMIDPTRVLATVSITLSAYMALLIAPEPVTKGVAAAFAVLLWGYLGFEFFELVRAYRRLSEEAARATTFAELREAGERFGRVIGPNSVRILVLVGTAAVGETAALMSRAPKLLGFGQASRTVELNAGLNLVDAAAGVERVIVSVPEGTLRAVLPMTAVAMAAKGGGGQRPAITGGKLLFNGHRAWRSHSGITNALGSPGKGKRWHHIVEQHASNIKRFGPEAIHNTENVIPLDEGLHTAVSAFYSSKRRFITGTGSLTVRQWIRTQSYEAQREFGLRAMENIKRGVWK